MAKLLQRTKRIDLSRILEDEFIPEWQDCYIRLKPRPFMEVQKMQADLSKLQLEITRAERKQEKIQRKLDKYKRDGASEELIEEAENEIDALVEKTIKSAESLVAKTDKIIKGSFVDGMIKDDETGKLVALTAEDCFMFEPQIKTAITQHITGTAKK